MVASPGAFLICAAAWQIVPGGPPLWFRVLLAYASPTSMGPIGVPLGVTNGVIAAPGHASTMTGWVVSRKCVNPFETVGQKGLDGVSACVCDPSSTAVPEPEGM